jgi:nucleotide-binding universal stress UspA family protein
MTRVLVPVEVLEGETVPPGLIDFLAPADVIVLGYHVVPEQTPPDQARAQFEDRATEALEGLVAKFREAGGEADHRLVFTHERRQTIDRIAEETGSAAYAVTGATGDVDDLLVTLSGEINAEAVVDFVVSLVSGRGIRVRLFGAGDVADRLETARRALDDAGIEAETVHNEGNGFEGLIEAVSGHDAVVMGERSPSLGSLLFGEAPQRIATASVGPVLVVKSGGE